MTYDPTVTAIATATNDALTDHLWRFDTATDDLVGHIAVELTSAAQDYNTVVYRLDHLLDHLANSCATLRSMINDQAAVYPHSTDIDAIRLVQLLQRFHDRRAALLSLYNLWRRHRPTSRDPQVRHLLLQPYHPSAGMVTLDDRSGTHRYVIADETASIAHGLPRYGTVLGDLWLGDNGWQATAYTDPDHRDNAELASVLPPTDTEAEACRELLRWWASREHPAVTDTAPHTPLPAADSTVR